MEWYGDKIWCLTVDELCRDDRTDADHSDHLAPVVMRKNYDTLVRRKKLQVVRAGKGKGNCALISYDSLPASLKARVLTKYPEMAEQMRSKETPLEALYLSAYNRDHEALAYYMRTLRTLNQSLPQERIDALAEEYTVNASVIKAIAKLRRDNHIYCKVRGSRGRSWSEMQPVIGYFKRAYGHTLGTSPTRFAQWVRKFETEGYDALISKKFGDSNTLKMSLEVERLLITIAKDPHQPYKATVWGMYEDFRSGRLDFYDEQTGELISPAGYPELSEKTVSDFLRLPRVRALLTKTHAPRHDYMTSKRPHHWREKPRYSLSMVTMDDKDFTVMVTAQGLKKPTRLKGYAVFDVASQAIIGYAFGLKKDTRLYQECVRSMYRHLLDWGLGQPVEAQVENHLVRSFEETMMKPGHLFPVVTYAGAQNSQEKYAERLWHYFKYGVEKRHVLGVGRHYGRLEANRVRSEKVSDASNDNYEQRVYAYDDAVRLYTRLVALFNAEPHPDQKLYPGKTRLEVLRSCALPSAQPIDMMALARWAGESTSTSIHRGVIHADNDVYRVSPETTDRLRLGSTSVTAYWWRQSESSTADEMYLYQGDAFLELCPRVLRYSSSKAERTEVDIERMQEQARAIARWDRSIKERDVAGLAFIPGAASVALTAAESLPLQPVAKVALPLEDSYEPSEEEWLATAKSYAQRAFADL